MPRRPTPVRLRALAALLAAIVLAGAGALPADLPGGGRPGPVVAATHTPLRADQVTQKLGREVFGFLPYWEVVSGVEDYLRYDLLTTIAFFSLQYRSDGSIDTRSTATGYWRYTGALADTIIERAHAAGVRVVPTIQAFTAASQTALLSDATTQSRAIRETVALMQERGADGVNVDVEGMPSTLLTAYGTFIGRLRAAVVAWNPAAQISVATGAYGGRPMASAALANGADRVFIMGYDYHYAKSTYSGAVAPLPSLRATLDAYAAAGIPAAKTILGLPYYGRTWSTVSDALYAKVQTDTTTYGSSTAFFPKSLPDGALGATPRYDDTTGVSVRLVRWDSTRNTWRQTYYDDPTTIAPKFALANERGLAGAGMWALGYDSGQPGWWPVLAAAFGAPRITGLLIVDASSAPAVAGGATLVAGSDGTTLTPPAGYTRTTAVLVTPTWIEGPIAATEIRLSNDGGASWSDWLPLGSPIPWTLASGPDGRRVITAQLRGETGALSKPARRPVVLDSAGPLLASVTVAPLRGSTVRATDATIRVAWSATDATTRLALSGLALSVSGGDWTAVALGSPTATAGVTPAPLGLRLRLRATAWDLLGNEASPLVSDEVRLGLTGDRSPRIVYGGTWRRTGSASALETTLTTTSAAGASASLSFTGRAIAIVGPVGPTRGEARVYVDGILLGRLNAYAATNAPRRVLFSRAVTPGTHVVRVVALGTAGHPRIDLDAFLLVR